MDNHDDHKVGELWAKYYGKPDSEDVIWLIRKLVKTSAYPAIQEVSLAYACREFGIDPEEFKLDT